MLIKKVQESFTERFGKTPMLVQSPGRINIIGEHTDYNGGLVFPAAIDKYIAIGIAPNKTNKLRAHSIDFDEYFEVELNQITKQKAGSWKNYVLGVVAELQNKKLNIQGFDVSISGNIPVGAGLSSSAAFECATVFGLNETFELGLTRMEMIKIAQKAEHNFAGVKCGIMDQYASMMGKKGKAVYLNTQNLDYNEVAVDFKDYEILLINTNVKHSLAESKYNKRREVCENAVKSLQEKGYEINDLCDSSLQQLETIKPQITTENYKMLEYVIEENTRVKEMKAAMEKNDLDTIGELLYQSHNGLQHKYKVSCDELDYLVSKAKSNGYILGGRMMGGGFGGCTINLVKKGKSEQFLNEIKAEYAEKFKKEITTYEIKIEEGTHIV